MQDETSVTPRGGVFPVVISALAILSSFALTSIIPPTHDTKVESTYVSLIMF